MRLRLLVTAGDPAGIGPEVTLAALSRLKEKVTLSVIGDLSGLRSLAKKLKIPVAWSRFQWIGIPSSGSISHGKVQPQAGRLAYESLLAAVRLLKNGQADALVTAPVSKEAIVRAGVKRWIGHTEFLAREFGSPTTMMFATGSLRVSLVTTHCAIRELPRRLNRKNITQTIRATYQSLKKDFGISRPRLGIASLNPHAGEGGLFGLEEKKLILPAIRSLRLPVAGPLPVDTLMQQAAQGQFDAVVALYHDQALIPIKLLGWEQAVNLTLGLPFVRTSPVHGTAFDIAGKGKADPRSMLAALHMAIELSRKRTK